MSKRIILEGKKFGELTVIRYLGNRKYYCLCSCGSNCIVDSDNLKRGHTKSCGCLARKLIAERSRTHGKSTSKIYRVWKQMIDRCENENNKSFNTYGGRGVSVCKEWHSFKNFYSWAMEDGYCENLTIERNDCDGNYCPQNCCWITKSDQSKNRRSNRRITYNGETKLISEWAEELGINRSTLRHRLDDYGWSIEKAFNEPVKQGRRY